MKRSPQTIGTQTSGLASAAQLYSGSDMSCVALPHLGTMVAPMFDLVCNLPVLERPSLIQQPEIDVEDPQLQLGLIGLLNFDLSPDQPAEGDIERPLEYHRSEE